MPILPAGSFRVSDYRKTIPERVKREVIARDHDFDHRPPLCDRDYDTEAGDFIPPQHDPAHIFATPKPEHRELTTGRKEGAEKTVTTRGSDVGERARIRDIRTSEMIHQAKLASRAGDSARAAELLSSVPKKSRLKPKRKIRSRPLDSRKTNRFGKRQRTANSNLEKVDE
ncbi:hypothetical protein DYI24_00380 [Rhodopseudomonas sp. BR0C11]|uniref:hypothetical protein n=1 Tax=Rhodopseudomonas sp. BR0C11 TaxID=2269370 RepID=UPI0013DEAA7B|nr:hypothetical protein [Rhodopseudomonas sp. BR0C11]NEV75537.1 hypothetical protein [Rhodopseudomonas sp. BR0C11]